MFVDMCRYLLFTFFLQLYFCDNVFPQSTKEVEYLGIEQGLSNNSVNAVFQDSYGFMWFGTFDGLNRYDGYNFKVYRNQANDPASLVDNQVEAIVEDADKNLWIGTKNGACIYYPQTGKFTPILYQPFKETVDTRIFAAVKNINIQRSGNILLGTAGKGLLYYKKDKKTTVQVPLNVQGNVSVNYHVQAITTDEKDRCWVFVQGYGLCSFDEEKGLLRLLNGSLRSGNKLVAGEQGALWVASEFGLWQYHIDQNNLSYYNLPAPGLSETKVLSVFPDKEKNELWIGTDGGGITIYNTNTNKVSYLKQEPYKKALSSSAVDVIYQDRAARKWIGTFRGGVNIIDPQKNRFQTISHHPFSNNSLIDNFVLSFCEEADGNIWIGTDGGGVSYWNRKQDTYTNYKHQNGNGATLSNNFVTSIIQDSDGNTWFATYGGGINRYKKSSNSFQTYHCYNTVHNFTNTNAWKLFEDDEKNLWAATVGGGRLYLFNKAADRFEMFDENIVEVIALAQDNAGQLWLGTFNSLVRVDTKNKKHKFFNTGRAVRSIHEDAAGRLWIGTEGGGLMQLDRSKEIFSQWLESDGLANNAVLNILEDKQGQLWLSTFNGISCFDPFKKTFKNYYEADGLQSNQFNYNAALRTSKGELLFGGIKGFNIFYPDSLRSLNTMPELLLTSFKINNTPLEQDSVIRNGKNIFTIDEIKLPYDKATISVDFAALEFTTPGNISYAYFMEGWDKDWNYIGKSRTANYSRLTEGTYKLRIKSTNAAGKWNPTERVVEIKVLPPWFRSWWAYSLYALTIIAAIYLYLIYKNRQAKLRYEIKLAHIEAENEKELNEKKLSFFTNVAHEFRTPLTLIINPVKELLYSKGQETDTGDLNIVYRNARRLLSLVDQLLLFRKAGSEQDRLRVVKTNFTELCREVYLCFIHQAKHKKIQYEFICTEPNIEVFVDREKIEIALFNLISNALKFTPIYGKISFVVNANDETVEVNIIDSGVGIPEGTGDKLFDRFYQVHGKDSSLKTGFGIGLHIVKKFIEQHKGSIDYSSTSSGTTFTMLLKKGNAHFPAEIISEETSQSTAFLEELSEETEVPVVATTAPSPEEEQQGELVTDKPVMLVVDDDNPLRQYVAQIFRTRFTTHEASSGEEGFEMAKKLQPDIIISDVLMSGISGIELCHKIKEDATISHTPVILLTSSASPDVKLKGVEGGADDYITKPFDKDLLVARVASILKSRNNLQKYFYNEITLQTNNLNISPEYKAFLDNCIAIVEKHLEDENFSIKTLANEIGMSHSNLYKKVKSISGLSINAFIRFIRMRKAGELFIKSSSNVNEVAFQVGMNDVKYFREQFYKVFGVNPSEYIKKYRKNFQKKYTVNRKS